MFGEPEVRAAAELGFAAGIVWLGVHLFGWWAGGVLADRLGWWRDER